jgi:hypothetical protein
MDITGFDFWEIKYIDSGEQKLKIIDGNMFEMAREFAAEHEVMSIAFYANIMIPTAPNRSIEKDRVYEKSLTKEELSMVTREWLEERRKEIVHAVVD